MGFVQIISFHTDRHQEFHAIEEEWLAATEGRRTTLRELTLVDRADPRHRVQVEEFASYESAMENSDLPETHAAAQRFAALTDGGVEFLDLDIENEYDVRRTLADGLRDSLATSSAPGGVFADDVAFEGQFPHQVRREIGRAAVQAALREEAPGRALERWEVDITSTGFVAEYAYRTTGDSSRLSIGVVVGAVERGRISRLLVTCAGSWDAAAEQSILGTDAGMVTA
jgi:hypothetical protein